MSKLSLALLAAAAAVLTGCAQKSGGDEPWKEANNRLIQQHKITARKRAVPQTDVPLAMEAGKVRPQSALPKAAIAPGVSATLAWGRGAMVEWLTMDKGAAYPSQQLNEEVITVVRQGSGTCEAGGRELGLVKDSVLYLTPGTTRTLKAGPDGLQAIEVFSPVRIDLLKLAGVAVPDGVKGGFPDQGETPSVTPGQVYQLGEFQLTPITDPLPNLGYTRSGAYSRLIWGRNVQLSFVRMDPHSYFPIHSHPEDQLMTLLRGSLVEGVMDVPEPMNEADHSSVLLPDGMVHDARMGDFGGDALDTFWPVRNDYIEREVKQKAMLDEVIAPDAKPAPVEGAALRALLGGIGGKPVNGARALAKDAKGGAYVANVRSAKNPPAQLYYIAPDGSAKAVIPAGEYAMAKSGAISPDGRTLYLSNAGGEPGENFLYAYDVQSDGSLTSKRKLAMFHLPDSALSAANPADRFDSGAGGMAVDMDGRIYVATALGVQIFEANGVYAGLIWTPQPPVNVAFGGKNGDVLYLVGEKQAWSVQTKVKGFRLPAGMD